MSCVHQHILTILTANVSGIKREHVSCHAMCRNFCKGGYAKLQQQKSNHIQEEKTELCGEVKTRVDQRTAWQQQQRGNHALFCIRCGGGRWRCLQMWQFSCDEKRGKRLKTRGGGERKRREVVEECALFIPADTSESLIHLEKGISQVTTYLLAFTHMHTRKHRHTMNTHTHTHKIANERLVEIRIITGSGPLQRPSTDWEGSLHNEAMAEFLSSLVFYLNVNTNDLSTDIKPGRLTYLP